MTQLQLAGLTVGMTEDISQEEARIEQQTRDRAESDEWKKERSKRRTASDQATRYGSAMEDIAIYNIPKTE